MLKVSMKHSHGNLASTILPILILASIAAAGWYYYYSEVEKNQSLTMESSSEQEKLKTELETLQSSIDKLLKDESNLQAKIDSQLNSQAELAGSLDKIMAEKLAMKNSLEQEVNRVNLTTAELEDMTASLDKIMAEKMAMENSLQQEVNRVNLTTAELDDMTASLDKIMAEKMAMENSLQQEVNRVNLTTAELEAELKKRQSEQESLNNKIINVSVEKSQLLTQLEQEQESKKQIASLKNRLEQELNESRVEISHLKNQMTVINLTSEVLFSSGSAEIKPAGQKVLSIIADSLNSYPDRAISVEGHTDNVPILKKGPYESNWELSAARGLAAVNYFQQNNQVDPGRLKVVGYGEHHPVASNDTAEGRKLNRRIEIILLPAETSEMVQN